MKTNEKSSMKIGKLFTYPIFTPNIFGIACWLFVVCIFALPEAVRYMVSNDYANHIEKFHPILFATTSILFLLWSIINDYSVKMRKFKNCYLILIILNWVIIPTFVVSTIAYNSILSHASGKTDLPTVIIMIYSILVINQSIIFAKLRMNIDSKYKIIKNSIVLLGTPIYVILNIYFCMFYVFSWIGWYRSI